MKKPIVTLSFLAACLLAGIFACKKYDSTANSNTSGNNIPPDVMVNASLKGRVIDQDGLPVAGAAISSGTATTTSDVNGVFSFSNISMSSRFGYVKVTKTGFFTGSRSIVTTAGASNFVTIQLVNRTETGSFPASSGGKIVVYSGDTVAFNPASIVTAATNAAYTGTVHVFATYLNPTNDNLYKYMPGDLRGIGSDGKETALQTFGMVNVELEDDAGNKLQITSGNTATLTFAIPSALQASAPATIPLWYFNDTTGRWIEQGMATRLGNNFVGNVNHFTFWNMDAPYATINLKARFTDQSGNPLAYSYVLLRSQTFGTGVGFTDSTGRIQGLIPKGASMVLQVVTDCGTVLGGSNVGPALADLDLGTIAVNITNASLVITGKAVDCSNNPVDSGFVTANVDGLNYSAVVTKGAFSLALTRCYSGNATIILKAGDYATLQTGNAVSLTASTGTVDAGKLSACGN